MRALLLLLALALPAHADDDDNVKGEFIPTGVTITPTAAKGSLFQALNPDLPSSPEYTAGQAVTTALSPDGKTLLILTSGFNTQNNPSGEKKGKANPAESDEYIFVYDVSGPKPVKSQVLRLPNAFDGLVWSPDGAEFYASGGTDDTVHFFVKSGSTWAEDAKSVLSLKHDHALGLGKITPAVAGLAITADGRTIAVANFENDSLSLIDAAARVKTAELDLRPHGGMPGGSYPFWVAIKGNNVAYVSSQRDREIVVVNIGSKPTVGGRIRLKSQPSKMILNKAQTRLYVAEASGDRVAVIDTNTSRVVYEINTTAPKSVFANARGYKGSSPNSLAFSPDEKRLYVTNGGANSVAVIENDAVVGLIPTGWYPNSISVSADGGTLYVVNGKSNAGPNPANCRSAQSNTTQHGTAKEAQVDCEAANQYVWRLTKAGFLTLPAPQGADLDALTAQVARNDLYRHDWDDAADEKLLSFLRGKIKHVVYVVKENRTYDQILGDLDKGNGDPKIVVYPRRITPNQHALADQFVDLDNFYDSGETSGDGWNWSTSARAADTVEKTEPVYYAGRGLEYDYEGTNREINVGLGTVQARQAANPESPSDPDILPGTADVSAPDGPEDESGAGYLWDSALRAGLSLRNYGFYIDLGRYDPKAQARIPLLTDPHATGTKVAYVTKPALQAYTDPYYRSFDTAFPDFYRVNEWLREFHQYEKDGKLPNLEFVRVMEDHTGSFGKAIDGVNTPEIQTADNDYAVGRIVEAISHSPRYKDNSLVFIVEDDAQDGPDHVDAHRSIAFIAGPYVKPRQVVSKKYTTVSMISTITGVLGIDHLGLNDAQAEPMTDCFQTDARAWPYTPVVPDLLKTTRLPLRMKAGKDEPLQKPLHDAAWWAKQTEGFDFTAEDKVDAVMYNRLLWRGIFGDQHPYPTNRSGLDLSRDREALLRDAAL
jgi:YVTN family beta-propeller protein